VTNPVAKARAGLRAFLIAWVIAWVAVCVLMIVYWRELSTLAKVGITTLEILFVPDLRVLKEHLFTRSKTDV
jgi:hypothetical protein